MLSTHLCRASRGSFLAGTAPALALFLAVSPAAAQSTVSATGKRTLTNEQTLSGSDQIVAAENSTVASSSIATTDATVRLDDNGLVMSARGNLAGASLSADSLDAGGSEATALAAGTHGVSAEGAAVIANRQSVSNANTGTVPYLSLIAIDGGAVRGSTLSASGNSQLGTATANGADAALTATGDGRSGAGIASNQSMDSASQSSGRANDRIDIRASSLASSTLANEDNVQQGIGTGNDVATTLTAKVGAVEAGSPSAGGPGMVRGAPGADPATSAHYAILTNQNAAGLIKGRAGASDDGPAYYVGVSGSVADAAIANDGNGLAAASDGNVAVNSMGIETNRITAAPGAAVADITDVQSTAGTIKAFTLGGTGIDLGTELSGSSVSASSNGIRIAASANRAGDSLTVKAVSADAGVSGRSSQASASATGADGEQHDAAFGVQTVQDFGASAVSAAQLNGATMVAVAGPVVSTSMSADDNLHAAAASGNSAASGINLSVGNLAATAALDLVQGGNGSVAASLGTPTDAAGTGISAARLADSAVSMSGNSATATAIGNDGTARLSVAANTLASVPGQASAGSLDAGYGATGAYVLATRQKLGASEVAGAVLPAVTATLVDRSGLTVADAADNAVVTLDGNSQRANALGNNGTNRLDISANAIDRSATSALSSSQDGRATVAATSSQTFATPGALAASRITLSDNDDIAYVAMNSVDNRLTVTGRGASGGVAVDLSSAAMGPSTGSGGFVLANRQFAAGTVDASASGALSTVGAADQLLSSTLTVAGNTTLADASANRAQNSVSLGGVDGGLANTQVSAAPVHAVAAIELPLGANGTQAPLVDAALTFDSNAVRATARGNAVDNALSDVGAAADSVGVASASAGAPRAMLNQQRNFAAVDAASMVDGALAPLNGAVSGSQLSVTGNTISATAYGNSANNVMTLSAPGAAPAATLVNMQTNGGAVSAVVTGTSYRNLAGPISGSTVALTGNQISAAATGNLANSSISTGR